MRHIQKLLFTYIHAFTLCRANNSTYWISSTVANSALPLAHEFELCLQCHGHRGISSEKDFQARKHIFQKMIGPKNEISGYTSAQHGSSEGKMITRLSEKADGINSWLKFTCFDQVKTCLKLDTRLPRDWIENRVPHRMERLYCNPNYRLKDLKTRKILCRKSICLRRFNQPIVLKDIINWMNLKQFQSKGYKFVALEEANTWIKKVLPHADSLASRGFKRDLWVAVDNGTNYVHVDNLNFNKGESTKGEPVWANTCNHLYIQDTVLYKKLIDKSFFVNQKEVKKIDSVAPSLRKTPADQVKFEMCLQCHGLASIKNHQDFLDRFEELQKFIGSEQTLTGEWSNKRLFEQEALANSDEVEWLDLEPTTTMASVLENSRSEKKKPRIFYTKYSENVVSKNSWITFYCDKNKIKICRNLERRSQNGVFFEF